MSESKCLRKEPLLLPVKPGSISDSNKEALCQAGVIVVEHENPSELRLLRPSSEVDSSAMLRCAMAALLSEAGTSACSQRERFTVLLGELISAVGAPR